jgi:hypothetical protein
VDQDGSFPFMQYPRGMERLAVEQRLRHRNVRQRDIAGGNAVENCSKNRFIGAKFLLY